MQEKKKTGESRWRGSNWMPANSHASLHLYLPTTLWDTYYIHLRDTIITILSMCLTLWQEHHMHLTFSLEVFFFFFLTNLMSLCYYVLLFYILYLSHTILLFSFYRWRNKLLEILNQRKSKLPKSTELESNSLDSKPSSTPNSST